MKVKDVKYASEVAESDEVCSEKSDVCDEDVLLHVWFDDGTATTVCKSCFDKHVNDGNWITDSADYLKPM